MAEPLWVTLLTAAVPTGLAMLTVALTREKNSGQDSVNLKNCVADVMTMKATLVTHATTLATHTVLHEHADERIDGLDGRLRSCEDKQAQALGREQGRRHTAGNN
jgi:hypothetical protein